MSLPEWVEPLYEAAEMRAVDAWAIDAAGVPSAELMERAGEGLARVAAEASGGGPVRVVVGGGNNGGDGLVAARLLRAQGYDVDVLSVEALDRQRGDARLIRERLPGTSTEPFGAEALDGSGVVVDCMLGTGFRGAPREPMAGAIRAVNRRQAPVVACDVPSGVDASSGEVLGEAVEAQVTATFHGSKVGLWVSPGAWCAGRVVVVPIGIPRGAPEPGAAGLIDSGVLDLVPRRPRRGSKFTSGVVVIAGGARGLTGAPTMTALSAMRAGAGYVQVAVPEAAEAALSLRLLEAMTRGLPDDDGGHTPEGAAQVAQMAERAGAVALGPGLGRSPGAQEFAREVARAVQVPLLVDADGLNAHVGALAALKERSAPTVLTPHAGELGRLLQIPSGEVDAHRLACARTAAERAGSVVVLKGHDSIVASPEGPVAVSRGASPALATAGTGDVLSGVIAALLAKGVAPFAAAAAGVLLHARAGEVAAERHGADHTIAGDVIDALPAASRR